MWLFGFCSFVDRRSSAGEIRRMQLQTRIMYALLALNNNNGAKGTAKNDRSSKEVAGMCS